MKIYKYYNGEIHSLEVRETKKMYIDDNNVRDLAFGCITHFDKSDGWAITPLEAIQEAINSRLTVLGGLKDRTIKTLKSLEILRELERAETDSND